MPPRNVYVILIMSLVAWVCHTKAARFRDSAAIGDAMALIDRYYVDRIDKQKLLTSAMDGLTKDLDPYTQYIPPGAYETFQDTLQQEFAGIGILIEQPAEGEGIRVVTPLVGSPALESGFRPGDRIIAVAGTDTSKAKMDEVSKLLRGPIGTSVNVRVRRLKEGVEPTSLAAPTAGVGRAERDGSSERDAEDSGAANSDTVEPDDSEADSSEADKSKSDKSKVETSEAKPSETSKSEKSAVAPFIDVDLVVSRANIQLDSIAGDYRNSKDEWVFRLADAPNIAYVRLTGFGERTTRELEKVLKEMDSDFDGFVLDLRGNAGGLLTSAVDICDMFLDEGKIVSTRGRGVLDEGVDPNSVAEEAAWRAKPGVLVRRDIPVSVLVDRDSASAAEIVAACLKDLGRATVIGERSFGKGSVQNVFPLENGRSALKLTTACYYRPNGQNIHRKTGDSEDDEWGVRPNEGYEVLVDDDGRRKIYRRLETATYPSIASFGSSKEDGAALIEDVDPQLYRAIESIQEGENGKDGSSGETGPLKQELGPPKAA
jgi:carboxyl-terminal processing protease